MSTVPRDDRLAQKGIEGRPNDEQAEKGAHADPVSARKAWWLLAAGVRASRIDAGIGVGRLVQVGLQFCLLLVPNIEVHCRRA